MPPKGKKSGDSALAAESYRALLASARADPKILGVVLSGSRGAGRGNPDSDFDVQLVVQDSAVSTYTRRFARPPLGLDIGVRGIAAFESGSDGGPQTDGSGPMYAHIDVPIDKTGRVAMFARKKASIPKARVRSYTAAQLDAYLNELLRSLKLFRDKSPLAAHLEATRSIPYLLEALFGSEGRWGPYARYLEEELEELPLRMLPWPRERLLALIRRILRDGDVSSQRALFLGMERSFRRMGYDRVFDAWKPSQLALMRGDPRD